MGPGIYTAFESRRIAQQQLIPIPSPDFGPRHHNNTLFLEICDQRPRMNRAVKMVIHRQPAKQLAGSILES